MTEALVIVESPTKARTVGRYLDRGYAVKASMGHVRDLPPNRLGVAVDDGFHPEYAVLPEKRKVVREVKQAARGASAVYLATDPDREGEAISWHLVEAAGLRSMQVRRVVFHEITEAAVREAFANPRELDTNLIAAQQARRVLDRLVGYQLSPLLWSKVGSGLSAGRVQSVAVRMVVEREREIRAFVPTEYWTIEAILSRERTLEEASTFPATLHGLSGQKESLHIGSERDATGVRDDLEGAAYTVLAVRRRQVKGRPAAPFTTSTLQQEAWRKLRYPVKKTMLLAQQLYEGVSLGEEGSVGLITYMRTDSTNVSATAVQEARSYVRDRYGAEFLPRSPRTYTTRTKAAQEAHEAIRPTSIERQPDAVRPYLSGEQGRLYDLIWKRMVASQMADSRSDATTVDIDAHGTRSGQGYLFRARGSVLRFPGFRVLYQEEREGGGQEEGALPEMEQGDALRCQGLEAKQHFTQPPGRYTEASLVRALEERGIGRPSTYAPIISTVQERDYVRKENGSLTPTRLGEVVNDLLVGHFANVVDPEFTAHLEGGLDEIARGESGWEQVVREFHVPLQRALSEAGSIPRVNMPTDETCERCGREMVVKSGRYGRFLSCSGYPECKNSRPYVQRVGVACPRCGGDLVERRSKKKGTTFYGCSNFPACNFAVPRRPLPQACPQCGGLLMVSGRDRARCTACDYKGPVPEEQQEAADQPAAVGA